MCDVTRKQRDRIWAASPPRSSTRFAAAFVRSKRAKGFDTTRQNARTISHQCENQPPDCLSTLPLE